MKFAAVLVLWAGALCAQQDLDAYIQGTMKEMQVPGAAVGIVRDGKTVMARGFGLRDVKRRLPATAGTIFAVGSVTKSFTAITVALMVDEKKLEWDRPVREYLPWFRMYDPVATELITPRDLLTHRSGMPRHDFIRFSTPLAREELVRRIRFLPNNTTFRDHYQYNNLMYVTAGYLAGAVAGTTWEDLVRDRIFQPLGMTGSTVTVADSQKSDDFAKPHEYSGGGVQEIDFYDYQRFGAGPNGAVNSSVNDLLKYVRFFLDPDQKLLSAASRRELWKPVTVTPDSTYALGWNVYSDRGHKVVSHGGAINGFTADITLLPDDKIGIVVLNNLASGFPTVVAHGLMDRLLGLQPLKERAPRQPRTQRDPQRIPNAKPSLPLSSYSGEYFHPAYGTVTVSQHGDGLRVAFAALTVDLKHYHYDTWEFGQGRGFAQFQLDIQGRPATLLLPLEPEVSPLQFTRVIQ